MMTVFESQAKAIFLAALDIESDDQRQAFVAAECGREQALLQEVVRLLAHHGDVGSFLESPAAVVTPPTLELSGIDKLGAEIGPFKLLQQLGEGGMGIVYLAERQYPVRQRVALKIIKQGMDTKKFIARFEAERQALAMMDHPNIAKVLDAGCAENGRPYFVMELVKGIPISDFCDENRLTTTERLDLFMQVCHAVHHAHQKGIIHRDIKPSNVLVALYDHHPVPKIIDFGVAKATNQQLTEKTLFTEVGSILGTWEYMSPEQAVLNQLDVDTRTDVYSLGVLLYELLTGETPLDRRSLRDAQLLETLRMIREVEPVKPSTRISSLGARATAMAAYRNTRPEKLASEIRGDLDWIVMKALAKERSRRYDSASRLADDVQRFLRHELVDACPPSMWYQAQKFYQRNKTLALSIAAVVLTLLVALAVLWRANRQLDRERAVALQATHEADVQAEAVGRSEKELQETLHEFWQELADRALDATFSGDVAEARVAIRKAKHANAPPVLTRTLEGLTLFFDGNNVQAIQELERVAHENPDSIAALSALSWVYYHSAQPGKHEENQEQLRARAPRKPQQPTVYDEFFACLERFVDGSRDQLEESLAQANDIVAKKHNWGAAYALRARLRAEIAIEDRSWGGFAAAIADVQEAYRRLPRSPLVVTTGLYVLMNALDLATVCEGDAGSWQLLAQELASKVHPGYADAAGIQYAAIYQYRHGDQQIAATLEQALLGTAEEGTIMWTAENTGYDKASVPVSAWRKEKADLERQVCVAVALVSSHPTAQEKEEARQIMDEILQANPPAAYFAIGLDIALLLGDAQLTKRIIDQARASRSLEEDFRWWKRLMLFQAGEITKDRYLEMAQPFAVPSAMAYYSIAMRALAERRFDEAEEYFRKTVATRTVGVWAYHNAQAFLQNRSIDSLWPTGP